MHSDPYARAALHILETPHGWCGRATYNREGGWGYLNALILPLGGERGERALIQWKVVILYLTQPYSDSTLHTSHIKSLQYKSLWMLNLFSLGSRSNAADLVTLVTKIEQPAQANQIMIRWHESMYLKCTEVV